MTTGKIHHLALAIALACVAGCGSVAGPRAADARPDPRTEDPATRSEDIPQLAALLASDDWTTATQAADDLGELGARAQAAVPALVQALGHWAPIVQHAAARALGRIGGAAAPAIPNLRDTFQGNDHYLMVEAAVAWKRIDPANQQSVPRLIALTGYGHPDIRLRAARALGDLGAAARTAVPALTDRLHDEDLGVRDASAAALAAISGGAASGRAPQP